MKGGWGGENVVPEAVENKFEDCKQTGVFCVFFLHEKNTVDEKLKLF